MTIEIEKPENTPAPKPASAAPPPSAPEVVKKTDEKDKIILGLQTKVAETERDLENERTLRKEVEKTLAAAAKIPSAKGQGRTLLDDVNEFTGGLLYGSASKS